MLCLGSADRLQTGKYAADDGRERAKKNEEEETAIDRKRILIS